MIFDHPSALCDQLAPGALDIALVSSFELLRHPTYSIVNGVSISSDGAVYSVIVAHRGSISEIEEIELDPASETFWGAQAASLQLPAACRQHLVIFPALKS
jgi:chorismate dehydratase